MYYLDVVDVLQLTNDQAIASLLSQLRGWALQVVLDLPFRFWLSETGEVVMLLGQYFDIIEKRLSLVWEENCDCTESIKSRGRSVTEEKMERENGRLEVKIKDPLGENSEEIVRMK